MASKEILSEHRVGAVVLGCIDFRFRKLLPEALQETFGIEAFDDIKLAGGAKNLSMPGKDARRESVIDDLALAHAAHQAKSIILLTHQNCGKYASEGHTFNDSESEQVFHESELKKAAETTRGEFPNADVRAGFVFVRDDNSIGILEVK